MRMARELCNAFLSSPPGTSRLHRTSCIARGGLHQPAILHGALCSHKSRLAADPVSSTAWLSDCQHGSMAAQLRVPLQLGLCGTGAC